MRYAIYTPAGRITKISTVPSDLVESQLEPGENYVESLAALDTTHYVDAGQVLAMPPRPSPHHIFDYATKTWIDPRTIDTQWPIVRAERDRLLAACDWAALPDVPITPMQRAAWAAYRQALRDITTQPDPFSITWPTAPL